MPDFVDQVFGYTSGTIEKASSILQSSYDVSKSALQYSYDTSKGVGGVLWNGTKGAYSTIQNSIPENLFDKISSQIYGRNKTAIKPEDITVSGLLYHNLSNYVIQNRKAIGICLTLPTIGVTAFQFYRLFVPYQRIAQRLNNRYRYEVILVIGNMNSTFVSKLVCDLNNRGYVVFVTVTDEEQLALVEHINDPDIRPLMMDYTDDNTVKNGLLKLGNFLDNKIDCAQDDSYYNFKGILFIPDYSKLPKMKKLEDINTKEFKRITEIYFSKFNSLLHNGLLKFIKESNNRREIVESSNGQKVKGGFAKLLFINFMVDNNNDNRKIIHKLAYDINKSLFNTLYQSEAVTFKDACLRFINQSTNKSLIDMANLDIVLHKNSKSTMIPNYPILDMLSSLTFSKMTPKDIHHKIYDLLNSEYLSKTYNMEG